MSGQEQVSRQASKEEAEVVETEPKDLKNEDLANDVKDILDEIDEVLEENAEEFVKAYIQKGGQ